MTHANTILVLGVTGKQGGSVARHLLAAGWTVRGLTRDASSRKAARLTEAGVSLVQGDMADPAVLERAMKDAHGVFSVQPPTCVPSHEQDRAEALIARAVIDAALRAGIRHCVYSSVMAADGQSGFRPDGKGSVERYLRQTGLPETVIRPAGFMENYLAQHERLLAGRLDDPTAPDVAETLVAVEDIGRFVELIFADSAFLGQTIDLAGDRLLPGEIAATLSRRLGVPINHNRIAPDELEAISPLLAELVGWLNANGYPDVDIAALRQRHPGLMTLEQWARGQWPLARRDPPA